MEPLLDVRGLTVELPTQQAWVCPVNEASLRVGAAECPGLVGESGSGKTMLSLALMGWLPAGVRLSGEAWLGGPEEVKHTKGIMKAKEKSESQSEHQVWPKNVVVTFRWERKFCCCCRN